MSDSQKINVLHVTNGYPSEKFPAYCCFIEEQIRSLEAFNFIVSDIVILNRFKKPKYAYFFGFFRLISSLRSAKGLHVVHCHHSIPALLVLFLRLFFKKFRVFVSFLNDPEIEVEGFLKSKLLARYVLKFIITKGDVLVVKHNPAMQLFGRKLRYLPNGVDLTRFSNTSRLEARRALGLQVDVRYLLFVSAISIRPQKRYDRFSRVLDILNRDGFKVEPLLLINEERERVPLFFLACDCHVLTSDYEGSPNSIKEAMACNTPCVSTPVGNVPFLLEGLANYAVTTSFSEYELAEKVREVLVSEDECDGRGRLVEAGLSMELVGRKLARWYRESDKCE